MYWPNRHLLQMQIMNYTRFYWKGGLLSIN